MAVGVAGDQRDREALLAEAVCDGQAQPRANADHDDHGAEVEVILRADALRNRQQLMTAAAELFDERGVDVPLEEIARRAGVSIGTLYNHFPNRGALLDAVLPDWVAEVDRLAKAALADPDPWRGFAGFMDGLFGIQARNRSMNDAIARTPVGPVDVGANAVAPGECWRPW